MKHLACYFTCSGCWSTDYNTCLTCVTGFYLLNAQCNTNCPNGYYANSTLGQCKVCDTNCTLCNGPDYRSNCTLCAVGKYYLTGGCYTVSSF